MNRRAILRTALAMPALSAGAATAPPAAEPAGGLIDCNIWLGQHPNRKLIWTAAAIIAQNLAKRGVTQAWASTFDAILHRDIGSANYRLVSECKRTDGLILPVGAINPTLPAWQDDVKRCAQQYGMKAIRLLPSYHGYELDDPRFAELIGLASQHKLLVQIVVQLEDERTQHPLLQVKPVDLKKLAKTERVMVLNANSAQILTGLRGKKAVLDTGMIEGVGGLEHLLKDWPLDQLVFGSHTPWFYWEANGLKLQESELTAEQLQAVSHGNARRLLTVA